VLLLGINFEIKFMEKVERLIRSINSLMIIIGLLLLTVLGLGAWILVRGNNSRSIPVADSTSLLQTSLDAEIQSLDKEEGMWLPPSDDELKKTGECGTYSVRKRVDCQHVQVFGSKRQYRSNHQWHELSKLPFKSRYTTLGQ